MLLSELKRAGTKLGKVNGVNQERVHRPFRHVDTVLHKCHLKVKQKIMPFHSGPSQNTLEVKKQSP